MARRRFLPKYVSSFTDRHGKVRYRYRRKGRKGGYFVGSPGSEEFRAEYHAFENDTPHEGNIDCQRPRRGTIGDLKKRYMSVPDRLGPSKVTQQRSARSSKIFAKEERNGWSVS